MSFFIKLFGQKEEIKKESGIKSFKEKDNMGTRQDTLSAANTYWIARMSSPKPDAASARAFLQEYPVTQQLYYLVVETPQGNICRDIQGIYTE